MNSVLRWRPVAARSSPRFPVRAHAITWAGAVFGRRRQKLGRIKDRRHVVVGCGNGFATRRQAKDLQAALLAALRERDGAMVVSEGAPARWRLKGAAS